MRMASVPTQRERPRHGAASLRYEVTELEQGKDACDDWNAPGARDVCCTWVNKRLRELGVEEDGE